MRLLAAGLFAAISWLALPAVAAPVVDDFDTKVDRISSLMGHDQAISEVLTDESEVRKLASYTPAEQTCLKESYRRVAKSMIHDLVKRWIATPQHADMLLAFGQTSAGNKFFASMKPQLQGAAPGDMTADETAQVQAFLLSPTGELLMQPPAAPSEQEESEYDKRVFGDCKLPVPDAVASPK